MKRAAVIVGWLAAVGAVLWFFPLFHVVSLDELQAEQQQATFDAAEFVSGIWSKELVPALAKAPEAVDIVRAIRNSPQQAREDYGRSVGLSRTYYYVFRGQGTIVTVEERGVGVSIDGAEEEPDLVLLTGLLFGNTIRDATGLVDAGDFENSQQFNEVSFQLNRIVETRVIPLLKEQAEVGRQIEFVGCAEVENEASDLRPLQVVPLQITIL